MFHIIRWDLPKGAFYGTAQGRNLDAVLDRLTPEERLSVWHVTEPSEHLLFRREKDARAYLAFRLAAVAETAMRNGQATEARRGQCRYAHGQHWKWDSLDAPYLPSRNGHITLWRHTESEEAARQARMEAAFQQACDHARRLFAMPGQREFLGAGAAWTDFLNAPSQAYAQQRGLTP